TIGSVLPDNVSEMRHSRVFCLSLERINMERQNQTERIFVRISPAYNKKFSEQNSCMSLMKTKALSSYSPKPQKERYE
ncbi:MAG: hypothetical protein QM231_05740, partial [Chloroflexota bacterium]|nr:hypothetical protein [Chloroflexota bacterium]